MLKPLWQLQNKGGSHLLSAFGFVNFRQNLDDNLDDNNTSTRIPHLVGAEAGASTDRGRWAAGELLSYLLATTETRFSGVAAACRHDENIYTRQS